MFRYPFLPFEYIATVCPSGCCPREATYNIQEMLLSVIPHYLKSGCCTLPSLSRWRRSFSGFDDNEDPAVRAARVKKLGVSKKWTVAALRDLCTLLGLEKGGDKVIGRNETLTVFSDIAIVTFQHVLAFHVYRFSTV